ncbi:hypothetical protein AMTR_s00017p00248130 [Amborella trichopoda]|uniref:Uncharacterized protein n=1 Tax=Amborella trichopoda TaxID=13333 RepID=W1PL62_AMBTC|nr:hypothetical protein AMTR_s00017p00248130 [Amborella trichopoda]
MDLEREPPKSMNLMDLEREPPKSIDLEREPDGVCERREKTSNIRGLVSCINKRPLKEVERHLQKNANVRISWVLVTLDV